MTMVDELKHKKNTTLQDFKVLFLTLDGTMCSVVCDYDVLRLGNCVNKYGKIEVFL